MAHCSDQSGDRNTRTELQTGAGWGRGGEGGGRLCQIISNSMLTSTKLQRSLQGETTIHQIASQSRIHCSRTADFNLDNEGERERERETETETDRQTDRNGWRRKRKNEKKQGGLKNQQRRVYDSRQSIQSDQSDLIQE